MKKLVLILVATIATAYIACGQNNYNVNNIADSLQKNADAVFRFYKTSYERNSVDKYTMNVHYAISILNQNDKHASKLLIFYDRNSHVTDIKGYRYNKNGNLQDKLKKKEIKDYAANNSYTLFSDHRVKYFKPAVSDYPYTIEYKYTIENKGIVGFNTWMPQKWFNISVEEAELSFKTSEEFDIKYKELNHDFIKDVTFSDGMNVYKWSAKNLKAIEYEPNAPNYLDFMPAVLLSPNDIVYEGTRGDFSSWKSYGKWVNNLITGRDELPEETTEYIKDLTDTISKERDKAKAIYKYMQNRTRYVNIALGIGGFQPIMAMDVDEKGYGDCKALSNYTKSLLKCAGIDSYYTEIGTGKHQEIKFTDFASANQTNHIILCVPLDGDTVWLECTNQKIPFAYISPGSQDRYALLIKPDGGELAKTPSFNANQNTRVSNIKLEIKESGDANFKINTEFNNNLYSEIFALLNSSEKEQKEELLKNLSSSKIVKIENFTVEDKSGNTAKGKLIINGKISNFASRSGARMFFAPEFFHQNKFSDFIPDERKLDIFVPFSYSYIDTLQINLPKNFSDEYPLKNQHLNSAYGQCLFEIKQTEETIIIIRKLSINKGRYGHEMFGEINKFLRSVSNYENKKIIITNKK
jgi:hypothetical protein